MARPRVAAGLLVRDDAGRILMVRPTYKDGWDIPGGYVEPDESPADAARRELREELGVDREPGRLLVVDWAPHSQEGDKLLFVFDGGTLSEAGLAALKLDGQEVAEARCWPVDVLGQIAPGRLVRRLIVAVEAASSGDMTYAEHGVAVKHSTHLPT
jgi:8-oxo-dGTP diphosphatase